MLSHEKLDVYKLSIKLTALVFNLIQDLPKGNYDIANQLKRAATSIPANIAEGVGKRTRPDQSRYYAIARGSAADSAALMDVLYCSKILKNRNKFNEAKSLLERIIAMLTKLMALK